MRVYTCCPLESSGCFQNAVAFLLSWGIEPSTGLEDYVHYLEFDIPREWTQKRKRAFSRALRRTLPGHNPSLIGD